MDYIKLAELYEKLESTTKRLEKTYLLSKFLEKTKKEVLDYVIYLLQGRVFPPWDERVIGFSSQLMLRAISKSTGISIRKVEDLWRRIGDLGNVAENLIGKKKQSTLFTKHVTVKKVVDNIRKLAEITGVGTVDKKISLVSELLTSAKPLEAKFIVRTVLEDLRTGVGEGTLRDAIAWAFLPKIIGIFYQCNECKEFVPAVKKCLNCNSQIELNFKKEVEKKFKGLKILKVKKISDLKNLKKYDLIICKDERLARDVYNYIIEELQHAYDLTTDFGVVAIKLIEKGLEGLKEISLVPGKPIKVMLYQKAEDIKDGFETVGKPAALEFKYDGFRLELHRKGEKIWLFTRRLEDVTKQFPDVVSYIKKAIKSKDFILDCETIGIDPKTGRWLPFQNISQRIKRKYDIQKMVKEIPVMVNIFDAMEVDGKNLLNVPFKERRKILEKIVKPIKDKIGLAEQIITSSEKEAKKFFQKALSLGNEGIMMKNLNAIYKPGSRVGYGVKVKPVLESLDLVITGAEWGRGKRATWLSSFVLACRDEEGNLLEVGKVGTGIKEKAEEGVSFEQLTKILKPLIIGQKGREVRVKPEIVVEVTYGEIQKSPSYSSGYALRFPRVVRLRTDRTVNDITTIGEIRNLYKKQHKK